MWTGYFPGESKPVDSFPTLVLRKRHLQDPLMSVSFSLLYFCTVQIISRTFVFICARALSRAGRETWAARCLSESPIKATSKSERVKPFMIYYDCISRSLKPKKAHTPLGFVYSLGKMHHLRVRWISTEVEGISRLREPCTKAVQFYGLWGRGTGEREALGTESEWGKVTLRFSYLTPMRTQQSHLKKPSAQDLS